MDAILIANESVDVRKISKVPGIPCKFEKAYDHLHWGFLWKTLEGMGFGEKWIKWMIFCITTVKFSILINGSPFGFFSSQRGSRQGEPPIPFLFILVMEGLHDMLRTTQIKGWIRESFQLKYLRIILILLEAISGLHINWGKSFIYLVNKMPNINVLAKFWGRKIEELPTLYLGMPLEDKSKSKGISNNVLEKCEKRI
ncbi:uncharacterized protein [Solanum tuberosum]|uniref:uncharacterized protein n=1 Tax=Solanum tuberosum TaxID=4113 RepID=UPI00073A487F|nr:PREDICTED: uncharacterized protein LOC107060459 [Solanum tuberosum]